MSLENKPLEISGSVIQILPIESGEGRTGQKWKKQYFVIEYMDGNYPKKVSIMLWGDKTDALNSIQVGSNVKVSFNVESREFNGRWYTDIKAWRVESLGNSMGSSAPAETAPSGSFQPAETGTNNDLPF